MDFPNENTRAIVPSYEMIKTIGQLLANQNQLNASVFYHRTEQYQSLQADRIQLRATLRAQMRLMNPEDLAEIANKYPIVRTLE